MKKILFSLLVASIALSCKDQQQPESKNVVNGIDRTGQVQITLIATKEATGSDYDYWYKKMVVKTKYFLIFDNGYVEETDIATYVKAKPGTKYWVYKSNL